MMESGCKQMLDFVRGSRDTPSKYKLFACQHCKSKIKGQEALNVHEASCRMRYCDTCHKTFHSVENYQKHVKNCPPKRFACTKCSKTYTRKSDKSAHEHKCCGVPQHRCTQCNHIFLTKKLVESHACKCETTKNDTSSQEKSTNDKSGYEKFMEKSNATKDVTMDEGFKTCKETIAKKYEQQLDNKDKHNLMCEPGRVNVETFVFLDLETISLIEGSKFPEITELSLICVHRDNLLSPGKNNLPRVMNKMILALQPDGVIKDSARFITGMYTCIITANIVIK